MNSVRSASPAAKSGGTARGGAAIMLAKASFVVFGFAQQLLLPYILGAVQYGTLSRVFTYVAIVNNVMVAASLQSVSRTIAQSPFEEQLQTYRRLLGFHTVFASSAGGLFFLLRGTIAAELGAPHIETPLGIVALVIVFYGIYAPMIGFLNARQRFVEQASFDIVYAILRLGCICTGGWLMVASGRGVLGAAAGFSLAAIAIVPAAIWRTGLGARGITTWRAKPYTLVFLRIALAQGLLSLLMQTDFLLLSRYIGLGAAGDHDLGDRWMGVYYSAKLFAFLPYQLLMPISLILFPLLAQSHYENRPERTKSTIRTGMRISLIIMGLLCSVISGLAPILLRLAFPLELAEPAGPVLRTLALGMSFLALVGITSAALTSLRKEALAMLLNALGVATVALLSLTFAATAPYGEAMLTRSSHAVGIAMASAATVGGVLLYRTTGAFLPWRSAVRVGATTAVCIGIGAYLPWHGKPFALLECAGMSLLYFVLLALSREITKADIYAWRTSFRAKP